MPPGGGVPGTPAGAPRGAHEPAENGHHRAACCSLYHRAIELVGKRWSGAILLVLMDGPLNFTGIRELVPDISDRLLSERLKELEAEGIVERRGIDTPPPPRDDAPPPHGEAPQP